MNRTHTFFVFVLFLPVASLRAEPRTWTDQEGRSFEGEFIGQEAGNLTIRRTADLRIFTFSIDRLNEGDQAYLLRGGRGDAGIEDTAEAPEFTALQWPHRTRLPRDYSVEIVLEDNSAGVYIYRTPHFEFRSDAKLARRVVHEFAKTFEGTLVAMQAFPLQWKPHTGCTHFQVRLFAESSDYQAVGGLPNSSGVYRSDSREIWVPFSSLGMRKTSTSYTFDGSRDRSTLIHEITHQVHHDWLHRLPPWITEGLAVYMESIPESSGEFRFDQRNLRSFVERSTRDRPLRMLHPEVLLSMNLNAWNDSFKKNSHALHTQYLSAFLLFSYFLHHDGERDGRRIWGYIRAIEAGESESEARRHLLDGRDSEALLREITRAFQRERIRIDAVLDR